MVDTMEQRKEAIKTLTFLHITLALYLLLWQGIGAFFELPVYYYARLIELLGILLFVALAIHTPMRFEEMGIITDKKTLFRSLVAGGALALFALFCFAVAGRVVTGAFSFSWQLAGNIPRATYFLVAPLQEVLAKSVMYYSFEMVLDNRHPHLANWLSGFTFAMFHVVYGIRMMCLSMFLCLLTGVLFRRVRCVWGCALTHFAFGFFPLCFGLS